MVLKVNLNIIIYEFDKDSNVLSKEFPCYLDNKPNIILLYRKTHYDLIYDSKNFERFAKDLCLYVNLEENLKVVNGNILANMKLQDSLGLSLSNPNEIKNNMISQEARYSNCTSCGKSPSESNYITDLNICRECLNNELLSQLMANYMVFLTESIALFHAHKEKEIPALFNQSKLQLFIQK